MWLVGSVTMTLYYHIVKNEVIKCVKKKGYKSFFKKYGILVVSKHYDYLCPCRSFAVFRVL